LLLLTFSFALFVLLITTFTFFLVPLTLSFPLFLFGTVLSVALSPLNESLLGFIQPNDVTDQLLLDLVVDHLLVVLLLGCICISFNRSNLSANLLLFAFNLLQLLLVGVLRGLDNVLLAFYFFDALLDGIEHFVDLRQLF